jgi:hypothetical protein
MQQELKNARIGRSPLRRGPKLGRPAVSKLTAQGHATPVNSQTIKNIEDGRIADPGIVTIARIVEAMGLRLAEFFAQVEGRPLSATAGTATGGPLIPSDAAQRIGSAVTTAIEEALQQRALNAESRPVPPLATGTKAARGRRR